MKTRCFAVVLAVVVTGLVYSGCKKDDNPATPTPAGPSGTFSFATDSGSFSASGVFNANATSGSGAGWLDSNTIAAYNVPSPTNYSVVAMRFMTRPAVGTFTFPAQVVLTWIMNADPNTPGSIQARQCMATSGTVTMTAHAGGTSRGTFSGTGCFVQHTNWTFTISNGSYSISSGTGKLPVSLPEGVERIARALTQVGRVP